MKTTEVTIKVENPVAYLEHKTTKIRVPVYAPIGWFKRFMLRIWFGLKYNKVE